MADKIEREYPHAVGTGPAGRQTLMALVRSSIYRGKLYLYVCTQTVKPQRIPAWKPNIFNWTDRWQYSQRKPWRK